jgi:hypothetical protein
MAGDEERDKERSLVLEKLRRRAANYKGSRSIATLTKLAQSKNSRDRLLALLLIREPLFVQRPAHFELARSLVGDVDNNCRWQALCVIGEFLESHTEAVWEVIDENAANADDDMQTALFCVLLEHLWVTNRREYRKRARKLAKKHAWLGECVDDDAFWFIRGTLPKSTKKLIRDLENTVKT